MPAGTWKKAARPAAAPSSAPSAPPSAPPVAGHRAWRIEALAIPALVAIALAAYANSFGAGLPFDNHVAIADETRIRAATSENLNLIFTEDYWYRHSSSGLYRPLTTLSYLFNYAILGNGAAPASYHWVNFLLHAVNTALVFWLALAVFQEAAPAFALAALWSVHPILTESVTNVVGRADLLAAFGVLAGLLCHIRSASARAWRKAAWLAAMAMAALIGCFSKESAVVVLAAVAIYDFSFERRESWRSRAPGYAALGGAVLFFLVVRARVLGPLPVPIVGVAENPLMGADFWTSRLTALGVLGKYLWLMVWPARLSADYSYNQVPVFTWRLTAGDWGTLLGGAACCACAVLAVVCWRRRQRAVFFFLAFLFAALAPTANLAILIGTVMAERFLYLPSIGFAGCLVVAVYAVCRRLPAGWPWRRVAAPVLLAAIGLAFAGRTFARNFDWASETALWTSAVQVCPDSYKTHQNLATAWIAAKHDPDGITREIDRMLAIVETLPDEWNSAAAYASAGQWYRIRGDALAAEGRSGPYYQKALDALRRGVRVDRVESQRATEVNRRAGKSIFYGGAGDVRLELGRVYLRLSDPRQAAEALAEARMFKPGAEVSLELSNAYTGMGDPYRATLALLEGLAVEPTHTTLIPRIAKLYQQTDPGGCAVVSSGKLVGLNMECPQVRNDICVASREAIAALVHLGRRDEAATAARNAVQSAGCSPGQLR